MRKNIIIMILLSIVLLGTGCTQSIQTQVLSTSKSSIEDSIESQNSEAIEEKEETKNITITSVGDIMMHNAQIKSGSLGNDTYDYSVMFRSIKPYIEKADFAMANLETTLSGKEKNYTGYPMFNSPEVLAKNIKDSGFDMLTTANNHSLDRRFEGVVKTIENLDKVGLLHTGTYKTKEDSEQILVKDINGIKVAFLAYTYGTNGIEVEEKFAVNLIDENKIIEDIKKAKALNVDMIIASTHFGVEYVTTQNKVQEDLVNFLFENGVDAVLGSHPHVLQPMEIKTVKDVYGIEKERFVIYSQGNIVANMPSRYKNSGIIVNLNIRKDKNGTIIENVEYIPTMVDSYCISNTGRRVFEILPMFSEGDYLSHPENNIIKQSFNDSIGILKSSSAKITLKAKK